MKTGPRIVHFGVALLLAAAAVHAQPAPPAADLTGTWTLQASAFPSPGAVGGVQSCDFQGTADITQTEGALTGDASMDLVSGPMGCPPTMSADVTGQVDGSTVQMGMILGELGSVDFDGEIAQGATQGGAISLAGGFQVTQGPFTGYSGSWNGVPGGSPPSPLEIPTLTAAGLAALALLLIGSAIFLIVRRRTA